MVDVAHTAIAPARVDADSRVNRTISSNVKDAQFSAGAQHASEAQYGEGAEYGQTDIDALARRLVVEAELTLRFGMTHSVPATSAALESVRDRIRDHCPSAQDPAGSAGLEEAAMLDQISLLEDIKAAASAAQARATHEFIKARTARETTEGIPLAKRGRGVGSEVALARRESPHAGSQATRVAYTLCEHMPRALDALSNGHLIDAAGTAQASATLTTAPQTSATQPDAALSVPTEVVRTDVVRTRAQHEADILVERLTGQAVATAVPVEINLVMTADNPFGLPGNLVGQKSTNLPGIVDDEGRLPEAIHASAWIPGFGPIPATVARDLLSPRHDADGDKHQHESRVFIRRILTDPVRGDITAIDTRRRAFTGNLRRALILRDDQCRTPWCGAPISHLDHTHPYAQGGTTRAANGTGLCARCNYTKEYDGWQHYATEAELTSEAESTSGITSHTEPGIASDTTSALRTVVTPTGLSYQSFPPPLVPDLTRRP